MHGLVPILGESSEPSNQDNLGALRIMHGLVPIPETA